MAAPAAARSPRPAPRPARARRWTGATAARAFGGYDVQARGRGGQRGDRPGAARPRCGRPGRGRPAPDRARRHAGQVAARRATPRSRPRWRRPMPRPRPRANRSGAICGPEAPPCPCREIQIFGGGAHAGRRVDIQDFMVVCPGAATFAQALDWTAEVYRAAGRAHGRSRQAQGRRRRGRLLAGLRDQRGGARDAGPRRSSARASRRGEQVAIALDVAASEFGRDGRYRLGLEGRELDSAGMIALLLGWLERYPIVSIEDPLAEDDPDGLRRVHARGRRALPGGRRRPHRDRCRTGARRGGPEGGGTRC